MRNRKAWIEAKEAKIIIDFDYWKDTKLYFEILKIAILNKDDFCVYTYIVRVRSFSSWIVYYR